MQLIQFFTVPDAMYYAIIFLRATFYLGDVLTSLFFWLLIFLVYALLIRDLSLYVIPNLTILELNKTDGYAVVLCRKDLDYVH